MTRPIMKPLRRPQSFFDANDIRHEIQNIAGRRRVSPCRPYAEWEDTDPLEWPKDIIITVLTSAKSTSEIIGIVYGVAGRRGYRVTACEKGETTIQEQLKGMRYNSALFTEYVRITLTPRKPSDKLPHAIAP